MFWWKFDIDKSATLESVWSAENVNDVNMWKLDSFVLFTFSFQIFTDKLRIRELLDENRISIVSSLCKRHWNVSRDETIRLLTHAPESHIQQSAELIFIFSVSSAKRWMLSSYSFSSTFSRYGHKTSLISWIFGSWFLTFHQSLHRSLLMKFGKVSCLKIFWNHKKLKTC